VLFKKRRKVREARESRSQLSRARFGDDKVLTVVKRFVKLLVGPETHNDDALGRLIVEVLRVHGDLSLPRDAVVIGDAQLAIDGGDQPDHLVLSLLDPCDSIV
jgi:hypothetical protein